MSDERDPRPVELGVIKQRLRAMQGIKDVILIWRDAVLHRVEEVCYLNRGLRNEPLYTLARDGVIRFVLEVPTTVPEPWRPFSVALNDLDDGELCWARREGPNYYIWQAEQEDQTRDQERSGDARSHWPEPEEGYRGVGKHVPRVSRNWRRPLRQAATRTENRTDDQPCREPGRVLKTFARGRLTVSCKFHYAQPPGEEVFWELEFDHRGVRYPVHHGFDTHDPKLIAKDILAHKEEILGRMKEITQGHDHGEGPETGMLAAEGSLARLLGPKAPESTPGGQTSTRPERSNPMGIDKSLSDKYPSVIINGVRYHYGREPEYGQYLVENANYAKDYWCFDREDDLVAFLAGLPETGERNRLSRLYPDWSEVTSEQRDAYMEEDRARLRAQAAEKQRSGTTQEWNLDLEGEHGPCTPADQGDQPRAADGTR